MRQKNSSQSKEETPSLGHEFLIHPPRWKIEKDTHVNVVNVKNPGVELETHGFGLLDWMSKLTVSLNEATNLCYMFEFVPSQRKRDFLLRENHQKKTRKKVRFLQICWTHMSCKVSNSYSKCSGLHITKFSLKIPPSLARTGAPPFTTKYTKRTW